MDGKMSMAALPQIRGGRCRRHFAVKKMSTRSKKTLESPILGWLTELAEDRDGSQSGS
jgi:hypothetical protein